MVNLSVPLPLASFVIAAVASTTVWPHLVSVRSPWPNALAAAGVSSRKMSCFFPTSTIRTVYSYSAAVLPVSGTR